MKKTISYSILIIFLSLLILISLFVYFKSKTTPEKIDYTRNNQLTYLRNNVKKIVANQVKVKYYIYPTFTAANIKYVSDYIALDDKSIYFDQAFGDELLDFDIVKSRYKSEINCIRDLNGKGKIDNLSITQSFVDIDNIPRNFKTYNLEDYYTTFYEGLKQSDEVKGLKMEYLDTVDTIFDKIIYFNYQMKGRTTKETRILLFKKIPMYDGTNCIMLDIRSEDEYSNTELEFSVKEVYRLIEGFNIVLN